MLNASWRSVASEGAPPGDRRVLMTNRPDIVDANGDPRHVWIGYLYKGSCGQVHGQTDDYLQVKSVTHYHRLPRYD